MPRLDGYPAADTLTGTEVTAVLQGGITKSLTTAQISDLVQADLLPIVQQLVAAAIAGLVPVNPPATASRLVSDTGGALVDDTGGHLLAL